MTLFYLGLNPRWHDFCWLPEGLRVMFSAAGFWNNQAKVWRRKRKIRGCRSLWLDPGGFTMLNRFGDYPFSTVEFLNLVAKLQPDYYASLDYPCEPDISRNLDGLSNRERIKATVRNAAQMAEWENQVSGKMVPVIQGYTLSEYRRCIDLHYQAGTIRRYMAVGSMCRRLSPNQLHRLVPGIFEHAKAAGVDHLHFFGLKLSPHLTDLREFIYSQDSAVVLDDYDSKLRAARNGRRYPRGATEKKAAFDSFFVRLDQLKLNYQSEV